DVDDTIDLQNSEDLLALEKAADVDDTIDLQNFDFQNDDFFDEFVSDLSPIYMNTLQVSPLDDLSNEIGETINVVDLTSEEKDITNEGKTEDVSNIAKVNEGLKSSESSYVLSSTDRSKLWISLISKEIDSLQNMTNISRELSDQDPKMAESFINVVRKKMKYTVALLDTGDKIHVFVRNGRLSYLNQYFQRGHGGSYAFSFARRSNTFNGDVNNTGFEVTKFCVIRSLNLDTDLPIDVTGEVISWEYELREYEVYGSKVKVLPIKLKDAVYVVDLKSEKMLDYIISYEVKDKFLVNVENARVFDDGKDPPMIYINYQTGSKFDIVDGITKDVEVPSKFVARHRMNEFKVAILRYGNKDFPMELHQNIVKLSKGKKQMYLTMEEKENRKLMKLKCSKHISLCDSEDKREVMEEDKEAVVLDVNFVSNHKSMLMLMMLFN
ncbi:hypothetical protein Tco_0984757, partial [Tanacetum coccineum]